MKQILLDEIVAHTFFIVFFEDAVPSDVSDGGWPLVKQLDC